MALPMAQMFWSKVHGLMGLHKQSSDLGVKVSSHVVEVDQPLTLKMPRKISSADLDECVRVLGATRVLVDCLRHHGLRGEYLATADSSVLDALPGAIEFLRAFSFDVDDYLAATPFSHEWMREHGHGD